MTSSIREDVYTRVTDRIVADLEQGTRPWQKPWSAGNAGGRIMRPVRANGTPYRGVNVLLLWSEAVANGYQSASWMTFKQAIELGGHVRKGEHGALVVYASKLTRTDTADDGTETERGVPFMKAYTVFNVDQIDNLPERFRVPPPAPLPRPVRLAAADDFFASINADVRHGGARAYYAPNPDYIQMPPFEAFTDAESYAATLAHELTHWTGHKSRLDRSFENGHRFGSEGYAFEELVAELGAAFVCADLGLTPDVRADHAAYLASWLKVLKGDKRAIFTAAAHAQRAADFLLPPAAAATTDTETA